MSRDRSGTISASQTSSKGSARVRHDRVLFDADGNAQVWGLTGMQAEAAFAAERVIVVAEEIVDGDVLRRDPNRTIIPGLIVDAVVHEPYGAHPSYAQGYYDRDTEFYLRWDAISASHDSLCAWLDEWVHGVSNRQECIAKTDAEVWTRLQPEPALSGQVDYGAYS